VKTIASEGGYRVERDTWMEKINIDIENEVKLRFYRIFHAVMTWMVTLAKEAHQPETLPLHFLKKKKRLRWCIVRFSEWSRSLSSETDNNWLFALFLHCEDNAEGVEAESRADNTKGA
jgi:hypothetical protein